MKAGRDKFAELLLYVAKTCANDPSFGATKLNKVLFFADFIAYRKRQRSITGATYQKLPYGPAPKCLLPAQTTLVRSGRLAIQELDHHGTTQKRPVALRDPDLSVFEADEIAIVDSVIRQLCGMSAVEVSEMSHGFWWQIADMKEEIPLPVALVELPTEVSEAELTHALSLESAGARLAGAA